MGSIALIIQLLVLIAEAAPSLVDGVKDLLEMIKNEDTVDITHEELVERVDAAIARLP